MKRQLWLMVSILLVTGCSFGDIRGGSGEDGVTPSSIKTIIQDYDVENPKSLQDFELLVMQGESAIAEVEQYITSGEPRERFLAVYVIGRVGTTDTVKPLESLLSDDNEQVRVAAAGTLANKGYVATLPVLIAAVSSTGTFAWLHPQRDIADFAVEVLAVYTGQTFGTDQAAWQQWWDETDVQLSWNAATKTYQTL